MKKWILQSRSGGCKSRRKPAQHARMAEARLRKEYLLKVARRQRKVKEPRLSGRLRLQAGSVLQAVRHREKPQLDRKDGKETTLLARYQRIGSRSACILKSSLRMKSRPFLRSLKVCWQVILDS